MIQLKRPGDYDMEEGARFEVHLTKARCVVGDDAQPFEAKSDVVDGVDCWTYIVLRDRELERVAELSGEGLSVRDTSVELNLSKSKVQRMQAKLRAEDRL